MTSSQEVIDYLKEQKGSSLTVLSIDFKNLYYTLPHDELLKCVGGSIQTFGPVAYKNNADVTVEGFLELLSFYPKQTYAEWDGNIFLQKQSVCIGSCIAPIITDLQLAAKNRNVASLLEGSKIIHVFCYVDDFLVLIDANSDFSQQFQQRYKCSRIP